VGSIGSRGKVAEEACEKRNNNNNESGSSSSSSSSSKIPEHYELL
jgi:hypothetical protein